MKRILLVDDEQALTCAAAEMLVRADPGIEVHTASNGLMALQIICFISFDLIVTDIAMPTMNGFELIEALNVGYPEIPVIVWAAYWTPEIKNKCLEMGIASFEELPFDEDYFYHKVRAILDFSEHPSNISR